MSGARLVAIALAACVAAGLLVWSRSGGAPPLPALPDASTAAAPAAPAAAETAAAREAAVPARSTEATRVVQVRGRCLAAEDGSPVTAVVRIGADDGAPVEDPGSLAHRALASVAADAHGHFACLVPIEATIDLRVHAEAPGRAPAGARQPDVAPGGTWDLGDIRLVRTAAVRGEVVDATGAPVADVEVGFVMLGHEPPALQFRESHTAVTDALGAFAFAAPLAAGEWYVRAERTGALRTPRKVMVPRGGELVVRIEVERPDPALALRGKVVDRDGAPLAGVALSAYGEGARGSAVSGVDGTFVVPKGPPHFDRGQSGIELLASADGYEQASASKGQIAAWGCRDVVVVMRPTHDVVVRALDARGRAVWPFLLAVGRVAASGEAWQARSPARQRVGGDHVVLPHLPSGNYTLLLVPEDPSLATGPPVPFVVDEHASREVVVRVQDRCDVSLEVVDGTGAPVPDCTVELVASLLSRPADSTAVAPDLATIRRPTVPGPRQVAVAKANTDAAGRATLPAAPGSWLLRARCTTHRPEAQHIVVSQGGAQHRLVLVGAAFVRGRLVPGDVLPALGLGATRPERRLAVEAFAGKDRVARTEVAADGGFTLGPLPPAVVTLQLATWLAANDVSNGTMPHALGSIDGSAPGAVERTFDVAACAPATATGIVLWDGQPLRHGQFFLQRLEPEPRRSVRVPTDGEGRFRTLVPPGTLGAQLAIPSDPGPGHVSLPLDERWSVATGQAVDLRIHASPLERVLRLLAPDGAPLRRARVQLAAEGYQRPGSLTTDGDGRLVVPLAPYGAFVVTTKDAAGHELVARCAGPASAGGPVFEVQLAPAGR